MYDYLNLTDAAFDIFFKRLTQYVAQKCGGTTPEWTHIPQDERLKLTNAYADWYTAYSKTTVPHSKIETEAKTLAKNAAKALIRPFVNRFLREDWEVVTNMDRDYLGIPNKDTTPTPHPVPDIKPETEAVPSGRGKHTVTAINPETRNKKKPPLVKGVCFAHRKREAADPKSKADDMPSAFQVSTTRSFQWEESDYGKTVDYAAAYENEGGKRGPWSDVQSLIIT